MHRCFGDPQLLFPAVLYFRIAVILKQLASEDTFITFNFNGVCVSANAVYIPDS